jgi:hypothetical protein
MKISRTPVKEGSPSDGEARLNELFRAYRAACIVEDAGPNFMPGIWAGIDASRVSTNWFGQLARVFVTAALAVSAILGIMTSSANRSNTFFDATFVEALRADRVSTLEPLHLDRISELEP